MLPQSSNEQLVEVGSSKASYSAVLADFTPAATATDFLILQGVAGKKVTLTKIRASGTATASSSVNLYFYKRTTLNTGGTKATLTACQHDSLDPAPSATASSYSVNPSGLGSGNLFRSDHLGLPAPSSNTVSGQTEAWDFANRTVKPIVLNGANESIAVNFGGNAVPAGMNLHVTLEWTEEG
jgi:hypothetical protein